MVSNLGRLLGQLETDGDVGCIVLTGTGGAFCAGRDVKGTAERTPGATDPGQEHRQRASQRNTSGRLWRMATPTIAVLPGPAAVLTTAFAKVGLSGDYGISWFLVRLVGSAKARELLLLSERVASDEAARIGLVNAVLDADRLQPEVMSIPRRLAHGPRTAHAYVKENVALALSTGLEDYMDVEVRHYLACFAKADHAEAARAFVDKRDPVFRRR